MIILDAHKIVGEDRCEDELVSVEEPSTAMHVVFLPHPEISVSCLTVANMWPNELTVSLLDAIDETATVLTAIFVDHVSFTSLFVERPITCIPTLLLSVNLNTEAVAQCL